MTFETPWLRIAPRWGMGEKWLWLRGAPVACTYRIRKEFYIPGRTKRLKIVFSEDPDSGVMCREFNFFMFVQRARKAAAQPNKPNLNHMRVWYWHIILDWRPKS